MKADITARDIVKALRKRHKDDLHMDELQVSGKRMDFWAMPHSWSKFGSIGYEIKVSRRDFEQDDKWPIYAAACHRFLFACPWGLIRPEELAEGVGLLWMNKGGRLFNKKHAVRSEPDPKAFQETLVRIAWGKSSIRRPRTRVEYAQDMADRVEAAEIGRKTAKLLSQKAERTWKQQQFDIDYQKREIKKAEEVLSICNELGVDLNSLRYQSASPVKRQISAIVSGFDGRDLQRLEDLSRSALELLDRIKKLQTKPEAA